MPYTLKPFTYAKDSLEPFMDSRTVEIHHDKHHQTYVDKLNAAVEKHPELFKKSPEELLKDLNAVPDDIRVAVKNMGGGVVNHDFFWSILKKDVKPSGLVIEAINKQWGSLDAFKKAFGDAAAGVFGSGWTWLVSNNGKLEIMTTSNQDSPLSVGKVPLLTIDVWEHAYYLKYMNKRVDFISAFWNIVDWEKVDEHFSKAK
jgi:Fe-Mn family superoxide dismutase